MSMSMTYKLQFHKEAYKEWKKLNPTTQQQFQKVLKKRLINPHIPSAVCGGDLKGCYKIKLRALGYRLIYTVKKDKVVVQVLAIGSRNRLEAYRLAASRL
ncbi:mRNA interferase RelE (plasmid) [Piscirickettsia salmonis]|nr:mRNA interferase RelE [Piscirickettsia salmonis]QGO03868.1 mRNA interferase RelE [Piscirickettsia salmonis]QGO14550.1 mRNA interferase RelE [Piscirickettsia salmonis]QGO21596.1 mRNA interferase RelE [Piscirickettsia salmonis]QGO68309.1 mRNA interferase RelE [Piscirickettsia salmonis]